MTPTQARNLGILIAEARARRALTIRDVEATLHIPRSWLGYVEQGRSLTIDPDRLLRLAEFLDIAPARIDRITRGSMARGLPELRTYFRAKYDLTPDQIAEVQRYVDELRRAA